MINGFPFIASNFNIQVDNDAQKELNDKKLNDKEFLEYITMTMPLEMFPAGKSEEAHISGGAKLKAGIIQG